MTSVGLSLDSSDSCSSGDDGTDSSVSCFDSDSETSVCAQRLLTWDRELEDDHPESFRLSPWVRPSYTPRPPTECSSLPEFTISRSNVHRTRMRRRDDVRQWRHLPTEDDDVDDIPQSQTSQQQQRQLQETSPPIQGQKKTSRLIALICAMVIVCLSQGGQANISRRDNMSDLRRPEIAFPPLSDDRTHERRRVALPKYFMPKIDTSDRQSQSSPHISNHDNTSQLKSEKDDAGTVRRRKPSLAFARSQHSLPVFGKSLEEDGLQHPTVEKFYFDSNQEQEHFQTSSHDKMSWTTSLAWIALFIVILEIGWKEYRRCTIDSTFEEERRL